MPLAPEKLNELEAVAVEAAKQAGAMIQAEAGKTREVQHKEGGDTLASQVVTEVDLEADRIIREMLGESIAKYDLGLLTEETRDDASRHRCEYFWCIDPLDGTLPFIKGEPGYSVSIALVSREGVAQVGVVFDPLTATLYQARRGAGARRNGELWTVEKDRVSEGGDVPFSLVVDRSFGEQPELVEKFGGIATATGLSGVEIVGYGGAALNACWVVEKAPAVYFKFPKKNDGGGSLWDFAAAACLFGELGLRATDIHGEPLKLNRRESTFMNLDGVVLASDEKIAEAVRGFY